MPNFSDPKISPFFTVSEGDYHFRFDGQRFYCVFASNHDKNFTLCLADFLYLLDVVIDDDTQFARIIRFHEWNKTTFTYRAYNHFFVKININHSNIK